MWSTILLTSQLNYHCEISGGCVVWSGLPVNLFFSFFLLPLFASKWLQEITVWKMWTLILKGDVSVLPQPRQQLDCFIPREWGRDDWRLSVAWLCFCFFVFFFWTEHCFVVGVKETLINSYLNIHFALGWGGFQQWLKRIMKEKRTFLAKLAAQHATSTSKLWQVFYSSFADTWKGGGVSILVITYIHLSQVFAHHINLLYVEHAI